MVSTAEKPKIDYEEEIITLNETIENPLDMDKIPVFSIENCEVMFSSLSTKRPQFGHNIQILLPQDNDLVKKDRIMRQRYLEEAQIDNPNLEIVKGSIVTITQKHVLDKKMDENLLNRAYIDFRISNAVMFDRTVDEEGKTKDKAITKASEATGKVVVKYFRALDHFTGQGIEPEVFKYENNEKVKTFINPKTKEESPIYTNRGDIVNIKIRPFGVKNKKTGDITLRYNILSIEIVQTAWDRGIGRTSGGKKRVLEAPEAIKSESLGAVFGDMFGDVTETKKEEKKTEKPKATKPAKKETKVEDEVPFDTEEKQETESETTLDFSDLANMDLDSFNLGE